MGYERGRGQGGSLLLSMKMQVSMGSLEGFVWGQACVALALFEIGVFGFVGGFAWLSSTVEDGVGEIRGNRVRIEIALIGDEEAWCWCVGQ